MPDLLMILICIVSAYLIGSIPTAVWYGKSMHGIDVREHGSGNAGATNTFRVLGGKAGLIVFCIDVLKGLIATSLAYLLLDQGGITIEKFVIYKLILGVIAVTGHIFPIFAKFKGGKGVATLLGMVIAIHWIAAMICLGIFIIVFLLSKYVSLGSMLAALAFPILLLLPRFNPHDPIVIIFAFSIFAMVVITHQKNIVRLLHGEENKTRINLRKKK